MPSRRPLPVPRAELPRLAAALRANGLSTAQIGRQLGVSQGYASILSRRGLEQLAAEARAGGAESQNPGLAAGG